MKHSELSPQEKETTEIAAFQNEKQKQLIGSLRIKRGHSLFKIDLSCGVVSLVDDNEFKSFYTIGGSKKRELIVKEGFWYDSALNKKNAIKKFAIRLSKELSDE
jgi:hypothetical protein